MRSPSDAFVGTWRSLPRGARTILAADFVSGTGSGLVLPFLAVYVSRVRDHGPRAGSFAVAALAVGSIVSNGAAGRAADRHDPRLVLASGWVLTAAADLALLACTSAVALLLSALLVGIGAGIAYPTTAALLAHTTDPQQRAVAYTARHGLMNVAFGVGIITAAIIVTHPTVARFQVLYAVDAASFIAAAAMLGGAHRSRVTHPRSDATPPVAPAAGSGYRAVLANRVFRWLCLTQSLIVIFGYVQFHAALPVYLSRPHGLSPTQIAVVFATNTIVVAAAAVPGGRIAAYVSRGNLIVAGCLAFSLCWVLLLASRGSTLGDVALAMTAAAAMGAGEVLLAASVPPLLNDLAPPDLIGRYNAVDALILSVGSIVGPVLTAALYFKPGASALLTVLAAGCAVAALVSRTLPTSERRSRA